MMQIEQSHVMVLTPDGQMPTFLCTPVELERMPAVLLLMEAFGLTPHIQDVAIRIAKEGYVVLVPDLYYRKPNSKFNYDEVEQAMAMMWRLDFGMPIEEDLQAALSYLRSLKNVNQNKVGVTGFCLGGGLTFLTACKFSAEIAAAAPFYGMILDEWITAVENVTVPVYLFFGGADPFISSDRIHQIELRFQELGKEYTLKVYPDAEHGFFCHERSSYNQLAAEDSWCKLKQFFHKHLREMV